MIRRFGAVLIGLALTLPLSLSVVSAHTNGGVIATATDVWVDAAGDTHVVGTVVNHTSTRQRNVNITATWTGASESASGLITSLAPHSTAPFEIIEPDNAVAGATPTMSATGQSQGITPVGALSIGSVSAIAANATTVSVTNDSGIALTGVVVYARRTGGLADDVASSAPQALAIGATSDFAITFDAESDGTVVDVVVAQTTSGEYVTSYNNLFNDLGSSNLAFIDAIAWMADEGITTGCGNNNFCPGQAVTRGQMAVFLDRALNLPTATNQGFTDIGSLPASWQEAINNLAGAGITSGCSTTPKQYCPNASVTRGQMSVFIVKGYRDEGGKVIDVSSANAFTDDNGAFHEQYNDGMKVAGVTSGCGADTYCPNSPVLREQMAVFVFKASNLPDAPPA